MFKIKNGMPPTSSAFCSVSSPGSDSGGGGGVPPKDLGDAFTQMDKLFGQMSALGTRGPELLGAIKGKMHRMQGSILGLEEQMEAMHRQAEEQSAEQPGLTTEAAQIVHLLNEGLPNLKTVLKGGMDVFKEAELPKDAPQVQQLAKALALVDALGSLFENVKMVEVKAAEKSTTEIADSGSNIARFATYNAVQLFQEMLGGHALTPPGQEGANIIGSLLLAGMVEGIRNAFPRGGIPDGTNAPNRTDAFFQALLFLDNAGVHNLRRLVELSYYMLGDYQNSFKGRGLVDQTIRTAQLVKQGRAIEAVEAQVAKDPGGTIGWCYRGGMITDKRLEPWPIEADAVADEGRTAIEIKSLDLSGDIGALMTVLLREDLGRHPAVHAETEVPGIRDQHATIAFKRVNQLVRYKRIIKRKRIDKLELHVTSRQGISDDLVKAIYEFFPEGSVDVYLYDSIYTTDGKLLKPVVPKTPATKAASPKKKSSAKKPTIKAPSAKKATPTTDAAPPAKKATSTHTTGLERYSSLDDVPDELLRALSDEGVDVLSAKFGEDAVLDRWDSAVEDNGAASEGKSGAAKPAGTLASKEKNQLMEEMHEAIMNNRSFHRQTTDDFQVLERYIDWLIDSGTWEREKLSEITSAQQTARLVVIYKQDFKGATNAPKKPKRWQAISKAAAVDLIEVWRRKQPRAAEFRGISESGKTPGFNNAHARALMKELKEKIAADNPALAEDMEAFNVWLQPRNGRTYYKFNNKEERTLFCDLIKRYLFETKYKD